MRSMFPPQPLLPPPREPDLRTSPAELYRELRGASGEDFEFLFAAFLDSARADPEAVARAIERGELPIG